MLSHVQPLLIGGGQTNEKHTRDNRIIESMLRSMDHVMEPGPCHLEVQVRLGLCRCGDISFPSIQVKTKMPTFLIQGEHFVTFHILCGESKNAYCAGDSCVFNRNLIKFIKTP